MNKKLFIILFLFVLVSGIFLRFYRLGSIPSSLNWDEVSWGYNAYSILKSGRDEYGAYFPLSFKAFGDFKQPVYVYADIFPVSLFGLTPFGVRFPSAFFGSLSIIGVYFLTKELLIRHKHIQYIALLAMGFFAISPWSIQFSRVAYEANLALFFVIFGAFLFVKGLNSKINKYLYSGIILLSISAYTYHSEKIFIPLFFLGLLIHGFSYFKEKQKIFFICCFIFVCCNLLWILDSRTTHRGQTVLLTSQRTEILKKSLDEKLFDQQNNDQLGQLMHNRRIVYVVKYIDNYFSHFNLHWLFIEGDNGRHHAPGVGNLYIVSLPFILVGLIYLFRQSLMSVPWIIFYWILLAPVASSLAVDAPNASRSLIFLPMWQIFEALGWYTFIRIAIKGQIIKIVLGIMLLLMTCNFLYYCHQYFVHTDTEVQKEWQYGYKEAIGYINTRDENKNKVIFAHDIEQGYIFYLFYNQYDPVKYIKTGGSARIWQPCFSIDNAYFGSCMDIVNRSDIYVTTEKLNDLNMKKIYDITYANNLSAVSIYLKK